MMFSNSVIQNTLTTVHTKTKQCAWQELLSLNTSHHLLVLESWSRCKGTNTPSIRWRMNKGWGQTAG